MPCCCETVLKPRILKCSVQLNNGCSWKEYRYPYCVPPFSTQSRQRCSVVCPLVRLKTSYNYQSCRSKFFRLFYERGDLPCAVEHTTKGQQLKWFVDSLDMLNLDYYLPIFADGLCEGKYPYSFIAFQG